jgi:predicted amidohydrolase YtcJ
MTGESGAALRTRLAIAGGDVVAAAPSGARRLDGGGRTVTPGLIDAHMHLLLGARSLGDVDLSQVSSRCEFEAAIEHAHAQLAPGTWLVARGWSEENWTGATLPDRSWLRCAGDRPVVCHRMDLHAVLVNDTVLEMCSFPADAELEREGGRVLRDGHGAPTGVLLEAAAWNHVLPLVPDADAGELQQLVLAAQAHLHALGVTSVRTMEYMSLVERVLVPIRDRLSLRCRVVALDRDWPIDLAPMLALPAHDRLALIGCKAFLDGTLGSRTARLCEPYSDDPANLGLFVEGAAVEPLLAWARAVTLEHLQVAMHAIGDAAVELALDVMDGLDHAAPAVIEHAQIVRGQDMPRMSGRLLSMQPLHLADDGRFAERRLGRARLPGVYAFRTLLDAGARLAFGSDWPVVSCDPVPGIAAAVTGRTLDGEVFQPEQTLTVEEALLAYTTGAAEALRCPGLGHLTPGAPGDLVIWDEDPFDADWAAQPPRVAATVVGGRVVYSAIAGIEVDDAEPSLAH